MCGFAFQVDKLVSEIEDHQLLHELSLEDEIIAEKLPSELDLSVGSSDSSMSGVAPLPPDPASDNSVQESGVAQLPPDELDCGGVENVPIPTACSMPICPLVPVAVTSSCVRASLRAILSKSPVPILTDSSYSSESDMMEEEQVTVVQADLQGGSSVVGPDSQMVESVAPQEVQTALSLVSTKAVIPPPPSDAASLQSTSSSSVVNLPQTPQHILPTLLQEAASCGVLGAAGRSEDPASTIQESVVEGPPSHSLNVASIVPRVLSAPLGSNPTPVDDATVSSEAVHGQCPALAGSSGLERDSTMEGPEAGHSHDPENTDSSTHPVSPSVHVALQGPLSSGLSAPDPAAPPNSVVQDLHPPNSSSHSPAEQLSDSSGRSPIHSSTSERSMDHLEAAEKLAPVGSHPSGSGQLSPGSSKPSTPVAPCGPPLQHSSDGAPSPDHAEQSLDSSLQLQSGEGLSTTTQNVETSVDSTVLDVTWRVGPRSQ